MNTYDARHLRLLRLISVGDWPAIVVTDLDELRTLSVCGYIDVSSTRSDSHRITLKPEGRHYMNHLLKLEAIGNGGAYQSSQIFQPLMSAEAR